jgi:hypothetical protein
VGVGAGSRNALLAGNWLILVRVAEMSHCFDCNFSIISEFKYIGDSESKKNRTPADSMVLTGTRIWDKRGIL